MHATMSGNGILERVEKLGERGSVMLRGLPGELPYVSLQMRSHIARNYVVTPRLLDVRSVRPDNGMVFRVSDGRMCRESVRTELVDSELERLLGGHRGMMDGLERQIGSGTFHRDALTATFRTNSEQPLGSLTTDEKVERCRALVSAVQSMNPAITMVRLTVSERHEVDLFLDRDRHLVQYIEFLTGGLTVFVEHQGNRQYATLSVGGTGGWEYMQIDESRLRAMVDTAMEFCGAKPLAAGYYDIVADPMTTGIIVHESFGHGVEADMFVHGRAQAAGYLGKAVGSPLVNIVDDPGAEGHGGSYFFDDEGELSRRTVIVEGGIFRQPLTDAHSSRALGLAPTPNGRRAEITRKVYARMSNTFFDPGDMSVEDLIAGVDHGIYLLDPWNGMEDPLGWGLQIDNHFGREIRGGKFTGVCYSPIVMTGTVREILTEIRGVANDFGTMNGGSCGKGHKEYLRVGLGGPHIHSRARLG